MYHLHKQVQIFSISSSESALMSSFDIFISHFILPLILVPFCRALCLPLAGITADPLGVSASGWLLSVSLKDQTSGHSNSTVGPPASCVVRPCQWKAVLLRHFPVCRLLDIHTNKGRFCEIHAAHGLEIDCKPTERTLTLGYQGVVSKSLLKGTK